MNRQRDRDIFLFEKLGECYPDWEEVGEWNGVERVYHRICKKCGKDEFFHTPTYLINFSTWEGFGKLWRWSKDKEWFRHILLTHKPKSYYSEQIPGDILTGAITIIDPDVFSDAVYDFLRENKQ